MGEDSLLQQIIEYWRQCRFLDALTHVWRLPLVVNYRRIVALLDKDVSLQSLIIRACLEAVMQGEQDEVRRLAVLRQLDECLDNFPPPPALVNHSDGDEAESQRVQMIHAYLACTRAALVEQWTTETISPSVLKRIAEETGVMTGFLRDLVFSILPQHAGGGSMRASCRPPVSTIALLVGKSQGVPATLILELMDKIEEGPSVLYPSLELAFIHRDKEFRHVEENCLATAMRLMPKAESFDVRWGLQRFDNLPIPALSGPSMGLAFTVGLAKLLSSL